MKTKKSAMVKKSASTNAMKTKGLGGRCCAHARSTGNPCKAKAMPNGRCKNHGGMSTGPKTPEGRQAITEATRQRMASGQQERALKGFYSWLAAGGRDMLSKLAKDREKRKRWKRSMLESAHASRTGAEALLGVLRLLRQHQSFETSIVRGRVMG